MALACLVRREGDGTALAHQGLAMVTVASVIEPLAAGFAALVCTEAYMGMGYRYLLCCALLLQWAGANTNAWLEAGALQLMTPWLTLEGQILVGAVVSPAGGIQCWRIQH